MKETFQKSKMSGRSVSYSIFSQMCSPKKFHLFFWKVSRSAKWQVGTWSAKSPVTGKSTLERSATCKAVAPWGFRRNPSALHSLFNNKSHVCYVQRVYIHHKTYPNKNERSISLTSFWSLGWLSSWKQLSFRRNVALHFKHELKRTCSTTCLCNIDTY